jgi:hypothetical protein
MIACRTRSAAPVPVRLAGVQPGQDRLDCDGRGKLGGPVGPIVVRLS